MNKYRIQFKVNGYSTIVARNEEEARVIFGDSEFDCEELDCDEIEITDIDSEPIENEVE